MQDPIPFNSAACALMRCCTCPRILAINAGAASIDLHEDNLIGEGYVYSQGVLGAADPLALADAALLRELARQLVGPGD